MLQLIRHHFFPGFSLCLIGLIVLSGCALVSPLKLDPDALQQLPDSRELSNVPFMLQQDYQCGPASLAMVLNYHGQGTTPEALVPWVFTPNAEGSFPAEMDAVTRQQGFISFPIDRLEHLLQEVEAGHPVLILQNLGMAWFPKWHFAVVIGFDQTNRELILRSGDLSRKHTGFHLFDTTWQRSGRWARVILPPHQMPATAQPLTYLKAAADLQQTGPGQAALQAFKTAADHWPDNQTALFGLANQYYQLQQWQQAQLTFEQLLQLHPDFAEGWNNYAYSLLAQQCVTEAKVAIGCAQKLAEQKKVFQQSAQEIHESTNTEQSCILRALCPIQ